MFLIELIQNVLQFINTNRLNNSNQNNQNKQFTYIINKSNLNSSKVYLILFIGHYDLFSDISFYLS